MSSQTVTHLRAEHVEIESVLAAFESYLKHDLEQAKDDHGELSLLIDSLVESVLLVHEEKEETILLPELSRHGLSWSDGTLSHVRKDHRHGRYLLRSLRHAAQERAPWSSEGSRHVASVGREWIEFNRRHMKMEESQLFPFIDAELPPETDRSIAAQFERIDAEFDSMPDAQKLRQDRDAFVAKHPVIS